MCSSGSKNPRFFGGLSAPLTAGCGDSNLLDEIHDRSQKRPGYLAPQPSECLRSQGIPAPDGAAIREAGLLYHQRKRGQAFRPGPHHLRRPDLVPDAS
jgi:hypothetical protein